MIVNKSMFPLQTGFSVLSSMQSRMSDLQVQLGTGEKASTLSGMGKDLAMSLSVRSRLSMIEGFAGNIDKVNLRLSFLGTAMERFGKIEGEARNSALPGGYGTGDVNMAMLPDLSRARFDEVVTLLNSDIAGRYVFGGSVTDKAPLPSDEVLLEGEGGRAGFRTVMGERRLADLGANGLGRLETAVAGATVSLTEENAPPFGFKLSNLSPSSGNITTTPPAGDPATLGVTFTGQPANGQEVTIGFTLPDGGETQITLRASTEPSTALGVFSIGGTPEDTAVAFDTALQKALQHEAGTTLAAASNMAAAENFFNGAGEPVLRVEGDPSTATGLRVADSSDTVMWYRGESPAVSAKGLGRLTIDGAGSGTVSVTQTEPTSDKHGFAVTGVSPSTANIVTDGHDAADPSWANAQFTGQPDPGETVTFTLTAPDGTTRSVSLEAVNGKAGRGQFTIGGSIAETSTAFSSALETELSAAAGAAEGKARQSVTAQVDDSTRVSYGVAANETGFLRMVRTMAALSLETFPSDDETSRGRFDAMAARQQTQMSEALNNERGSIEIITMELGIAEATVGASADRHTNYQAQLENLLADAESVSREDVAMEILALQTRLQASYQVTSMVSQLSLVNFL
jgi:flagellin-like hook-associated protein FlgL